MKEGGERHGTSDRGRGIARVRKRQGLMAEEHGSRAGGEG